MPSIQIHMSKYGDHIMGVLNLIISGMPSILSFEDTLKELVMF